MTIRNRSYEDYGMDKADVKKTFDFCQDKKFSQLNTLKKCAMAVNPIIADLLVLSITKDLSYERIDQKYYIPYSNKSDFYGYRRKVIFTFWLEMIMSGELKVKQLDITDFIGGDNND